MLCVAMKLKDKAARAIEKLGGGVGRDKKTPGKPVTVVILIGTPVTDSGLKELAAFKQLKQLLLDLTEVSDAGMKELAGSQQLQAEPPRHEGDRRGLEGTRRA